MLSKLVITIIILITIIAFLLVEHYTFKRLLHNKEWKYWQFFLLKAFNKPLKAIIILLGIIYLIEFSFNNINVFTNEICQSSKFLIIVISLICGTLSFIKKLEKYYLKFNSLSTHHEKERQRSTIILFTKLSFVSTLVIGILILLYTFGIRMQAIVTVLSLSGVAVGISSRDLVASLFGTMFIYINGPFSIGDRIKINSYEGIVENITWLSTRIRLDNTNLVKIPNIQFLNIGIENVSFALQKRVIFSIIAFSHDYHAITKIITEIVNYIEKIEIKEKIYPAISTEIVELNEHHTTIKFKVYFYKYTTKPEILQHKLLLSAYVFDLFNIQNMRFNLKFDD